MLKMSFMNGTMDREKLKEFIDETEKPIRYTYGFGYRNPTIHKILIDKEKAMKIVKDEYYLDAEEFSDYIHLNAYSNNDMW